MVVKWWHDRGVRFALPLALTLCALPVTAQAPPAAIAQPANDAAAVLLQSRAEDAMQVFNKAKSAAEVFSPDFLKAVPPAQLAEIGQSLHAQFGPILGVGELERISPVTAKFNFHFAKAMARVQLRIDPETTMITGLLITDLVPLDDSPQAVIADFAALHGKAGFTITRLGAAGREEVLGHKSDQQFAIGSAFKLWVLDALAHDIALGKRKWSDVVPLSARSLPSGVMQGWPQGTPVTLATLATQMISISDNTATDMLIKVLGREAIAARVRATGHSMPSRMLPMLSTLEAFSLKLGPAARREAYAAAGDDQQLAMLQRFGPGLSVDAIDLGQLVPDKIWHIETIEWFASPRDVAGVLQSLQRRKDPRVMQILSVNSGIGTDVAAKFTRFGFKGGSEEGVLNLSWVVQNKAGQWYAISASWNDPERPVDQMPFLALTRRLLERVK